MQLFMIYYYILINILLFLIMAYDKRQAVKRRSRISERTLIFTGILGGAIGGLAAMYVFRHKTKKPLFKVVYLAVLLIHIYLYLRFFYQ